MKRWNDAIAMYWGTGTPLEIIRNGITKMKVDAIVNPINRARSDDGGLDGAIHCAVEAGLMKACRSLGDCNVGEAKITRGYHRSLQAQGKQRGGSTHGDVVSRTKRHM